MNGEVPIQSFKDWKTILDSTNNKVGVLTEAFKTLHPDAPKDDYDCAPRLAGMLRNSDPGFILLKIWQTSPVCPAGSHLNYICGCLKVPRVPVANKYNPAKYTNQHPLVVR